MNKSELVQEVSKKTGVSMRNVGEVLDAYMKVIAETLKNDEKLQIIGFGTFETAKRAERTARNPKTGESIIIPASTVPKFKPGKALKDAIQK